MTMTHMGLVINVAVSHQGGYITPIQFFISLSRTSVSGPEGLQRTVGLGTQRQKPSGWIHNRLQNFFFDRTILLQGQLPKASYRHGTRDAQNVGHIQFLNQLVITSDEAQKLI